MNSKFTPNRTHFVTRAVLQLLMLASACACIGLTSAQAASGDAQPLLPQEQQPGLPQQRVLLQAPEQPQASVPQHRPRLRRLSRLRRHRP